MAAEAAGVRVLVLGAGGQVGREVARALAPLGRVAALGRGDVDLTDADRLRSAVVGHRPAAVVIAAAYTAVDRAEQEPALAHAVNAVAPGVLAAAATEVGACVVYYSTDYVFDGAGTRPWHEMDPTGPLSVYGRTKRDGERAVAACPRHLTFRTSWVISAQGTNFVRTILRLAAERQTLRVVSDQIGAPTSAAVIAGVTAVVLAAMIDAPASDPRWGTYHLQAAGETSWHELARHVIARASANGAALVCAPDDVLAIGSAEYPAAAVRPLNSRLDTTRLRATFGLSLPAWRDDVNAVVDQLCPRSR